MKAKVVFALILVLLVVVFTLQNTEVVEINFVFWHFAMSRALLIFIVLGVGILIGLLGGGLTGKKTAERS